MDMPAGFPRGDFRFPKGERLKGRDEIRAVFEKRQAVSCAGARLLMLKNGLSHNRIAFTFSRKFGCAAERNRSRRVSREAYRHFRRLLKPGWDLVLLVYPGKDDFSSRLGQFRELLGRSGLMETG
jgi:ribonuclease P protein component